MRTAARLRALHGSCRLQGRSQQGLTLHAVAGVKVDCSKALRPARQLLTSRATAARSRHPGWQLPTSRRAAAGLCALHSSRWRQGWLLRRPSKLSASDRCEYRGTAGPRLPAWPTSARQAGSGHSRRQRLAQLLCTAWHLPTPRIAAARPAHCVAAVGFEGNRRRFLHTVGQLQTSRQNAARHGALRGSCCAGASGCKAPRSAWQLTLALGSMCTTPGARARAIAAQPSVLE